MNTSEKNKSKFVLLVLLPEYSSKKSINSLGSFLCGDSHALEEIEVLALNAEKIEGIKPILEQSLAVFLKIQYPDKRVEARIAFFRELISKLDNTGAVHKLPDRILEELENFYILEFEKIFPLKGCEDKIVFLSVEGDPENVEAA